MESFFSQYRSVYEAEDLRRFSRSIAELQWLLLILVLLYYFIPIHPISDSDALILVMVCYAAAVIVSRYPDCLTRETRWKLALETWLMIAFISLALWHTGLVESPLLNLCLRVIEAGCCRRSPRLSTAASGQQIYSRATVAMNSSSCWRTAAPR